MEIVAFVFFGDPQEAMASAMAPARITARIFLQVFMAIPSPVTVYYIQSKL